MASAERKITLKTSDGEHLEVNESVAFQSQTLKNLIADDCDGSDFSVPDITGKILAKVMEYCKKHVEAAGGSDYNSLKAWDTEFVKVDQATLFNLTYAADYLDIKSLLDLTCQTFANMIKLKGITAEEIRKIFLSKTT